MKPDSLTSLPATTPTVSLVPIPADIPMLPANATPEEIKKDDMQHANKVLKVLDFMWTDGDLTLKKALALSKGVFNAIEQRRKIMGMPYGHSGSRPISVEFEVFD